MTMDQQTFLDLASGKGNAQKMFMQGKIKIKVLRSLTNDSLMITDVQSGKHDEGYRTRRCSQEGTGTTESKV